MAEHPSILLLQHIDCEPMAAYGDELAARGVDARCVRMYEGEELPAWSGFAAIVAMGGPMGAYDEELHPWLRVEKTFIAEAVGAGVPYWGVCLGAQLLSASLGASVTPGALPEVGVLPVMLTDAAASDPVFAGAPSVFGALQWHSDTYELPPGAVRLARSVLYEQQAFAIGAAYGLQFHLEVTPELAAGWAEVPAYAESLERILGRGGSARLLYDLEQVAAGTITLGRDLFGRWLERVVRIPSRAPGTRAPARWRA